MKKKIIAVIVFGLMIFGGSLINNVFASSANITQINFTSSLQTINVNTNSAVLTTQTQNNTENPEEQVNETTTLNYTSTSKTGQFSDASISKKTCNESTWSGSLTLSLSSTHANKGFCYKDSTAGTYILTVTASVDGVAKDWTSATQKIIIIDNSINADTVAPIITLNSNAIINLNVGDAYIETVTATDDVDGPVIPVASGSVDINTVGVYTITYTATDKALNVTTAIRTVNVTVLSGGGGGGGNPEITKNIHLAIETKDGFIINKDISVVPCDDKGIEPITAYCALDQLEKSGVLPIKSDWSGLWINSINGIVNNENNDGIYWMWLVNLNTTPNPAGFSCSQDYPYSCSAKEYFLKNNDQILFYYKPFVDPADDSKQEFITPASGGGGSSQEQKTFSVSKALDFLFQSEENSPMYADWVAIAAGAGDNSDLKTNVSNYLKSNPINSNIITDNERRSMALMALGINPYNGTEINYIKKITDSFDGKQFGDENLVNDDIFALIPLVKVGYNANDEMIAKDIDFILSKQNLDGSWEGSVDITSAAVQSLKPFDSAPSVSSALTKAGLYIKNKQENNGGWGNISSSSWATQAMNVLGESWIKEGKTATDYFNAQQETDGAVLSLSETIENRIWATSYVVPAMMSKPWGDIMQSFQKPDEHVFCPKGDLFSTTTGQACTATNETNFIVINTPITNPNSSLVKNIENKKNVETPQEKNIKKPNSQIFGSPTSKTFTENNLGASVGDTVPIKISVKKILQVVSHLFISILTYIGKGFVDLIIFLQNQIVAIFK